MRRQRWLEPVPAALQQQHAALRQREFVRLVRVWWPLLLAAFAAFIGFTVWLYAGELHGPDRTLFAAAELAAALVGLTGLWLSFRPAWQAHHERWLPWAFGLIVATKLAAATLMASRSLAVNEVHMAVLVTVVGALGLQLGVRAVARGCAIGALGLLAAAGSATPETAWLAGGHYGLTAAVCVFVAAVRQDKDRMAFYQSVSLEMERQEVQRLNQELGDLARRDGLTGLANRRAFMTQLTREAHRHERSGRPLSILILDIDHFKRINDEWGHATGDEVLVQVGRLLQQHTRDRVDLAARIGGEEFVVLLPETDLQGAQLVAEKVAMRLREQRVEARGGSVRVSVSMGVTQYTGGDPDLALRDADRNLYRAKEAGRDRIVSS